MGWLPLGSMLAVFWDSGFRNSSVLSLLVWQREKRSSRPHLALNASAWSWHISFLLAFHWPRQITRSFLCSMGVSEWKSLSRVWLFATPWTIQSMEFSRQEYWSGLPFPSPGDLPDLGIEPRCPTVQMDFLPSESPGKTKNTGVGSLSLLCALKKSFLWGRCNHESDCRKWASFTN